MPDILIRGLTEAAVAKIDAEAARLGLSRNEYLRRRHEADVRDDARKITPQDRARAARMTLDLSDPEVMAQAWR